MALTDPEALAVPADRRTAIADGAIAIIARDGLRALTHRAVDRELRLPPGSTSYYARTRRLLIHAVVQRLADRTTQDLQASAPSRVRSREAPPDPDQAGAQQRAREQTAQGSTRPRQTVEELSAALAALLDQLELRAEDHRARYALAVDLTNDPELHDLVTIGSPIRAQMVSGAQAVLELLGVADPSGQAPALITVVDGLLFDRLAGSGRDPAQRPDAAAVLLAYLSGLPRATPG